MKRLRLSNVSWPAQIQAGPVHNCIVKEIWETKCKKELSYPCFICVFIYRFVTGFAERFFNGCAHGPPARLEGHGDTKFLNLVGLAGTLAKKNIVFP